MALGGTQSPIATEGDDSVDCELSELYERGFTADIYLWIDSAQPHA